MENCIAILSAQAEEAGVRLELEEAELQHSRVIGNSLHVMQILMNIIDNALKYNRVNGSVFVPFTQEHPDARTNYNGVGLGMSVVKKLVEQMKGTIEVDSQGGRGSVFRVTLPIRVDKAWSAQPAGEERNVQSNIAGMRVLLVEDNEINCEIVEFMLEDAGAKVVTANDGKAAVDAFAASAPGTFDCVLMDLMMPVMSGYEAARVIRGLDRPDAKTVPIIALSANAFDEDVAMAKDAGMNEHLAKPVDTGKMFRVMCRLGR